MPLYRKAQFLCSAHQLKQAPTDAGFEVAFAGRSNAGKSSTINALTGQKSLARTSKTPGRTQQIIFFELDAERRLVDLPGYGYAKVPLSVKQHWQNTLSRYLQTRESLRGLVLMMDVRHPLTEFDQHMLQWCITGQMPVHILLTKSDKLSYGKASGVLKQVTQKLAVWESAEVSVQLFSALKRQGLDEVKVRLNHWLEV